MFTFSHRKGKERSVKKRAEKAFLTNEKLVPYTRSSNESSFRDRSPHGERSSGSGRKTKVATICSREVLPTLEHSKEQIFQDTALINVDRSIRTDYLFDRGHDNLQVDHERSNEKSPVYERSYNRFRKRDQCSNRDSNHDRNRDGSRDAERDRTDLRSPSRHWLADNHRDRSRRRTPSPAK